jgi:hypothetical protein
LVQQLAECPSLEDWQKHRFALEETQAKKAKVTQTLAEMKETQRTLLRSGQPLNALHKKQATARAEVDQLTSEESDLRAFEKQDGQDVNEDAVRILENGSVDRTAENKVGDEQDWRELEEFIAGWLQRRLRRLTAATESRRRCEDLTGQIRVAVDNGGGICEAIVRLLAKAAQTPPTAETAVVTSTDA